MKKSMVISCRKAMTFYELVAVFLLVLVLAISLVFPIDSADSAVYPSGIVSYWQFDESTGNTASDSVAWRHGVIDGAARDNGLVGGALRFDGIDDIVRLPVISGYGDFTMSAWFTSSSNPSGALFQTGMGYIQVGTQVGSADNSALYLTFADRQGGGGTQMAFKYNLLTVNFEDKWHFIVMTGTAENGELKAYFDGSLVGSLTWGFSGWSSTLNYSNIGALKASLFPGNHEGVRFSGLIDEVAVFNRALPADEISLYYQTGLHGLDLSNPIPIPTTMLLLGSGLMGLAGFRRGFTKR